MGKKVERVGNGRKEAKEEPGRSVFKKVFALRKSQKLRNKVLDTRNNQFASVRYNQYNEQNEVEQIP